MSVSARVFGFRLSWVASVFCFLALGASSGCPAIDDGVCSYGGQAHDEGASFPSTDGCNTCTCLSTGGVACTEKACGPGPDGGAAPKDTAPGTCSYGGKTYAVGRGFPSTDGCNSCSCTAGGEVACTLKACLPGPDAGVAGVDAATASDAGPVRKDASSVRKDGSNGGICQYGDKTYEAGASFPSTDGCNECHCGNTGVVGCTKKACPPKPDAGGVCALSAAFDYGSMGGLVASQARSYVSGVTYRHERVSHLRAAPAGDIAAPLPPPQTSCSPPLPACGSAAAITPHDLEAAFADPEVQQALRVKSPPTFGVDGRAYDATVFEVKRTADGASFLVGTPCGQGQLVPPQTKCTPPPAPVAALVDLLRKLDAQQLATDVCKAVFKN